MRKCISIILALILIATFTACQSKGPVDPESMLPIESTDPPVSQPLSDLFIQSHDNAALEEICSMFQYIHYGSSEFSYDDIKSAGDIPQTAMYLFFASTNPEVEKYFDKKDDQYHFPRDDIQSYIDQFFDGYVCKLEKMAGYLYDSAKNEIIASALGRPSTFGLYVVDTVETTSNDTVVITYSCFHEDSDVFPKILLFTETLTLKVLTVGYTFISSSIKKPNEVWDDNEHGRITIISKDINETLKIKIVTWEGKTKASLDHNDIEKIVISENLNDEGYYEVYFWLTTDGVKKAEPAVSYISDFAIDISINGETFKCLMDGGRQYHWSRAFSSITEGLKGFDCPLFESQISREDFRQLFTK